MTVRNTNGPIGALSVELHMQAGYQRYVLVMKVRSRDGEMFTMKTWPWMGTQIPEGILYDALGAIGRECSEMVYTCLGGVQTELLGDS